MIFKKNPLNTGNNSHIGIAHGLNPNESNEMRKQNFQTLNNYLIENNMNSYMNIINTIQNLNTTSYINSLAPNLQQAEYNSYPSTPSHKPEHSAFNLFQQVNTPGSTRNFNNTIYNELLNIKRQRGTESPHSNLNGFCPSPLIANNFSEQQAYYYSMLNNSNTLANNYEKLCQYLLNNNLSQTSSNTPSSNFVSQGAGLCNNNTQDFPGNKN